MASSSLQAIGTSRQMFSARNPRRAPTNLKSVEGAENARGPGTDQGSVDRRVHGGTLVAVDRATA
jgi:hypothetical protein